MNTRSVQMINLSVNDLTDLISNCVKAELEKINNLMNSQPSEKEESKIISRSDASILLKLSYTTLWKHSKSGLLPCKKLGNKVYYFKQDVYNLLNNVA